MQIIYKGYQIGDLKCGSRKTLDNFLKMIMMTNFTSRQKFRLQNEKLFIFNCRVIVCC